MIVTGLKNNKIYNIEWWPRVILMRTAMMAETIVEIVVENYDLYVCFRLCHAYIIWLINVRYYKTCQ